ncbi:unnamed protein product, partial [Owenia fusiformis]
DLVRNNGEAEAIKAPIHKRVHWPEIADRAWQGELDCFKNEPKGQSFHELERMQSPRLLASHLPAKFMPDDVIKGKCKTILVIRNPKSVMVSLMFMLNGFGPKFTDHITVDIMMNSLMTDTGSKALEGTWFQHVEFWM